MPTPDLTFAIPTYRLRDVGATVESYDEHVRSNAHAARIIVFDDSSLAGYDKYDATLAETRTQNPVYYVGPREKEAFLAYVNGRLRNRTLESVVKNLFRPSYGGNRNFTLMYTLGDFLVSSDDDMRPYALMEDSPESLVGDEVARGRLFRAGGYAPKLYDLLRAFLEVLGRPVGQVPRNFAQGELLEDSTTDLETNMTRVFARENTLRLRPGIVPPTSIVKMAQTFRSGTNDIDAHDFVEMFLDDASETDPEQLNDLYALVNFRPVVTKESWRMDCGIAAYDNTIGLPPFFPTRLRFEDYVYRLWMLQNGVAAAHVDAVQTHVKSNYMRNPLPAEVFNEEVANLLKRKIRATLSRVDDLSIEFDYTGEVTFEDSEEILARVGAMYQRVLDAERGADAPERRRALQTFAANLNKAFYGFEPDFFQQNVARIVDDVVTQFHASLTLWPTLVEICYFQQRRGGLRMTRVENHRTA